MIEIFSSWYYWKIIKSSGMLQVSVSIWDSTWLVCISWLIVGASLVEDLWLIVVLISSVDFTGVVWIAVVELWVWVETRMVVVGFTVLVIKGVCTEVDAIDVEYFSEKLLKSEKIPDWNNSWNTKKTRKHAYLT